MARFLLILSKTALVALTTLVQCCSSDSRVSQARIRLDQQIIEESEGEIKLLKFEKTDCQAAGLNGVKAYMMDFKAVIEYQDACFIMGDMWGGSIYNKFKVIKNPKQDIAYPQRSLEKITRYSKGTRVELIGKASYEKKESGWLLEDILLIRSDVIQ